MIKPFKTYPGGKGSDGTYQNLINFIPPHDVYIDGCLGNSELAIRIKPATFQIGVDIDPDVITAWEQTEGHNLQLHHGSILDFLKNPVLTLLPGRIFIYLDPPYPFEARRGGAKPLYRHEMTEADQLALLKTITSMGSTIHGQPIMIMISSYENALYNNYLKNWLRHSFPGKSRRGGTTETIYMNYAPPVELHDYQYLGRNFSDRQRIKKKIARHVSRLMETPVLERQAILQNLNDKVK